MCSRKYSDYFLSAPCWHVFGHVSLFLFCLTICNQDVYWCGLFAVTYQINQYLEKRYLVCLVPFKRLPVKSIDSQKEWGNLLSKSHQNKSHGNIHQARTFNVENLVIVITENAKIYMVSDGLKNGTKEDWVTNVKMSDILLALLFTNGYVK